MANIVAAKMGNKILAPMQYNGTTDAPLFEFWFEQWLLPCLPEDVVIVMDNASFHSKDHLNLIAETYNRQIIFLPSFYKLLQTGELKGFKEGNRYKVPAQFIEEYVDKQMEQE